MTSPSDPVDDLLPAARRPRVNPDDSTGVEWVVDAFGCTPDACRSVGTLGRIIEQLVDAFDLNPVRAPLWQTFEGGGVAAMLLLSEAHITCRSFPESGFVAFNVFFSERQPRWQWDQQLTEHLGASHVIVRELIRG